MKHSLAYHDDATSQTHMAYRDVQDFTLDEAECNKVPPFARGFH